MTQVDLAEAAQSHQNFLGGVERGEKNISVLNLCYIAAALEVAPHELLRDITAADAKQLPPKSSKRLRGGPGRRG